jgi:DNA modification methylase
MVKELEVGLLKLNNPTYNNIDNLMRSVMKKYNVTAKELHYSFRDKHNDQTPDEWIKSQRTKKMKTFKEFLEEAHLYEMRRGDGY